MCDTCPVKCTSKIKKTAQHKKKKNNQNTPFYPQNPQINLPYPEVSFMFLKL